LPGFIQQPADAGPQGGEDVAPAWHTAVLIALIVAVAVTGTLLTRRGVTVAAPVAPTSAIPTLYVQMILVAWGLLFYVCRVGRPRCALRALVGEGWTSVGRAAADLALAASAWLLIEACEIGWTRLFATGASASVAAMLPGLGLTRL
jgi:hypothetical protein